MTTARSIITGALTFHLNRLSPGEAVDADVGAVCLDALNHIADEMNGQKAFLFREVLTTSSAITGTSAALGVAWSGLSAGDEILGATVQYSAGMDVPLLPISMEQYANIAIKTTASLPQNYAHDGQATVYFYPACSGQTVTLRTKQVVSDFADLDTDYTMPKGYKSAMAAMLAEKMAPSMLGGIPAPVAAASQAARNRLAGQAVNPSIIGGNHTRGSILSGFR